MLQKSNGEGQPSTRAETGKGVLTVVPTTDYFDSLGVYRPKHGQKFNHW